jgi:hypothetical protein
MAVEAVSAEAHLKLAQTVRGERWEQIPCGIESSECIEIPGCAKPQDLLGGHCGVSHLSAYGLNCSAAAFRCRLVALSGW